MADDIREDGSGLNSPENISGSTTGGDSPSGAHRLAPALAVPQKKKSDAEDSAEAREDDEQPEEAEESFGSRQSSADDPIHNIVNDSAENNVIHISDTADDSTDASILPEVVPDSAAQDKNDSESSAASEPLFLNADETPVSDSASADSQNSESDASPDADAYETDENGSTQKNAADGGSNTDEAEDSDSSESASAGEPQVSAAPASSSAAADKDGSTDAADAGESGVSENAGASGQTPDEDDETAAGGTEDAENIENIADLIPEGMPSPAQTPLPEPKNPEFDGERTVEVSAAQIEEARQARLRDKQDAGTGETPVRHLPPALNVEVPVKDEQKGKRNDPAAAKAEAVTAAQGTRRDVIIGVGYFIVLLAVLFGAAASILSWKKDIDVLPTVSYDQLCWSQKNDCLAFVRTEKRDTSKGSIVTRSLWTADRFGTSVKCITRQLPQGCRVIGWSEDDAYVILSSPNKKLVLSGRKNGAKDAVKENKGVTIQELKLSGDSSDNKVMAGQALVISQINVKNGEITSTGLNAPHLQLVGTYKNEIFLAEYSDSEGPSGQINLISWEPSSSETKLMASIPARPDEVFQIEQAESSPNGAKLAVVVSVLESSSHKFSTDDTPLGVWLVSREQKSMEWTPIAANNAEDLRVAWSADSSWMGGIAKYSDSVGLFAFYGPNDSKSTSMRGLPKDSEIKPFIINGKQHEMIFISDHRADKYNFDTQTGGELISARNLNTAPSSITVSSSGAAAYISRNYGSQNIHVCTLNNPTSSIINVPADAAKQGWLYRFAVHLEYAEDYWLGKN